MDPINKVPEGKDPINKVQEGKGPINRAPEDLGLINRVLEGQDPFSNRNKSLQFQTSMGHKIMLQISMTKPVRIQIKWVQDQISKDLEHLGQIIKDPELQVPEGQVQLSKALIKDSEHLDLIKDPEHKDPEYQDLINGPEDLALVWGLEHQGLIKDGEHQNLTRALEQQKIIKGREFQDQTNLQMSLVNMKIQQKMMNIQLVCVILCLNNCIVEV